MSNKWKLHCLCFCIYSSVLINMLLIRWGSCIVDYQSTYIQNKLQQQCLIVFRGWCVAQWTKPLSAISGSLSTTFNSQLSGCCHSLPASSCLQIMGQLEWFGKCNIFFSIYFLVECQEVNCEKKIQKHFLTFLRNYFLVSIALGAVVQTVIKWFSMKNETATEILWKYNSWYK